MREASVGHQCPECVREGRRTQRPVRTAFGGSSLGQHGYVTFTLIAINILMLVGAAISARSGDAFAGGTGWGGLLGSRTPLHEWGAVLGQAIYGNPPEIHGIAEGEYYRLFTAMFLQYGLLHLLLNMWALWVLGRTLEAVLGPVRFLAIYLIAGLGGNVAAYLFSNPAAATAGASGAIFGLFAALFIVLRKLGRDTSAVVPILVINLVFTFTVSGISIAGHLGGLVVGALAAVGMAYAPRARRVLYQSGAAVAILIVLALLTVARTSALTG
jgi:membrane associated rhomboid family serine protease